MKFLNIRASLMAVGACAALLSTSAHAVWTFNTGGTQAAGSVSGDPTVTLSGFSVANSSGVVSGSWTGTTANASGNGAGGLAYFDGGVGMYTSGETTAPDHALDNKVRTEAVLLSFGGVSTAITSVGLGWVSNGTTSNCASGCNGTTGVSVDVSLFRWTGGSAPVLSGTAATLGGSWELVGNYGMGYDKVNPYNAVNSGGKTSSWWLISAYNSGFTQSGGRENVNSQLSNGNDFFKLYAVAGTKCASNLVNGSCATNNNGGKVPEPATLALTSVALIGVAGLRRRRAKTAA
ncbi:exosortase-dependent surface protein XDP1 [uncultured Aquabacterium sp.]|uniref:exosortase-dependent surface protein XDP1 n=1 Tax=uncultured Aquabacterium sp. TaxID=158753 RepID=UPI0025E54A73|nr:exosortase-dependent surface protein XDP1 [uncultured Aquabacterium sp.]